MQEGITMTLEYLMAPNHPLNGGHHDLGVPHKSQPPSQEGVTITLGYPMGLTHPHNWGSP